MMRPKKKGDVGRWNSFYEIVFTSVDTFPSSMLPCLSPVSAWQIAHVCMHVHMCVCAHKITRAHWTFAMFGGKGPMSPLLITVVNREE